MLKLSAPSKKIRILLVDDHMVIRMGLMTAVSDASDMEVVADVENGPDAIKAYRKHRPDIVILDLRLHGLSGVETLRTLREEFKSARILVFSSYAKGEEIYQAMKAGASGFVMKEMPLDRLLGAIRAVHEGDQYIPPEIAVRVGERLPAQLSPRELDVLQMLGRGLSNKEIGAQLGVSDGAVKATLQQLFQKTGVRTRSQLVRIALEGSLGPHH